MTFPTTSLKIVIIVITALAFITIAFIPPIPQNEAFTNLLTSALG